MSRVILTHPEDLDEAGPTTLALILQALKHIRDTPGIGEQMEPLKEHQRFAVKDMTAWSFVRIPGHGPDGEYRIIYRTTEQGDILVLAIGPRIRSLVYQRAADRLAQAEQTRRRVRRSRKPDYRP